MSRHKFLTFRDLQEQNPSDPIWVINTSDRAAPKQAGDVVIAIHRSDGPPTVITIPLTWLPIDLTEKANRNVLLASPELRSSVNKELIGIITDEYAKELLAESGAKEELKRIQELERNSYLNAQRTISEDAVATNLEQAQSGSKFVSAAEAAARGLDEYKPGISQNFRLWSDRLATMQDAQAVNAIRMRRNFTLKELKFMLPSVEGKQKAYSIVESQIAERRARIASKKAKRA